LTGWHDRSVSDLVLILRYREAVTYGFHALLGALETHETATRYEVQFAESLPATIDAIRAASAKRSSCGRSPHPTSLR
jgi:hypothetical protein